MTTVKHPQFDLSREVPDERLSEWLDAGWVDVNAAPVEDEPEPVEAPKPRRK